MPDVTTHLIPAVETYFAALHRVRASGDATGERSAGIGLVTGWCW